jgi:hypothetical protein
MKLVILCRFQWSDASVTVFNLAEVARVQPGIKRYVDSVLQEKEQWESAADNKVKGKRIGKRRCDPAPS